MRARDKMPQAVLFPTVSLLSNHTNLEPQNHLDTLKITFES